MRSFKAFLEVSLSFQAEMLILITCLLIIEREAGVLPTNTVFVGRNA